MELINTFNDWLWSYILIALLLAAAVWFTLSTKGVQFRMFGEMLRLLAASNARRPQGIGTPRQPPHHQLFSGIRRIDSLPSGHRQSCRRGNRHCDRRRRLGFLDVGNSPSRSGLGLRGVDIGFNSLKNVATALSKEARPTTYSKA